MFDSIDHAVFSGICLSIFATLTPVVCFQIHPYVKKITNKWSFWIIFSLIFFGLFVFNRHADHWVAITKWFFVDGLASHRNQSNWDITFSRAFLLEICPFGEIFLILMPMFQPSRKIASKLAPVFFFSGLSTIWSITGLGDSGDAAVSYQYIFLGGEWNPTFYLTHYYLVLASTLIMLNTPNKGFKTILHTASLFTMYLLYVIIVSKIFNVNSRCSGTVSDDWIKGGTYWTMRAVLKISFLLIFFVSFSLYAIFIVIIISAWIFWQKMKKYQIKDICQDKWWVDGYYVFER